MAKLAKLLQAAAGAGGGAALNVEDVFSTYLYEGNQSTKTITNNIDLSGEGGLVWIKNRDVAYKHALFDTERGTTKLLSSNLTNATVTESGSITSFNSNGFTLGSWGVTNGNNEDHASWTFRKAPKFFDVVTYTGDGSGDWDTREISHNLGATPGFIIIKRTDSADDWWCAAKKSSTQYAISTNGATNPFGISTTNSAGAGSISSCATDSVFMPGFIAQTSDANINNATYVAYLFAHNDGDGEFGDGTQDIIKCGSYTGNGSSTGPEIDLGFEPQWLLVKSSTASESWYIINTMSSSGLRPNASSAETTAFSLNAGSYIGVTSTGFNLTGWTDASLNGSGQTYIYIAIRRGPMAVPESATDVFAMDFRFSSEAQALNPEHQYYSGFPVDMHLNLRRSSGGVYAYSRLQGGSNFLTTSTTDAEVSSTTNQFGSNEGLYPLGFTNTEDTTQLGHMWKRAPNFFDVVAWEGDGTTDKAVNHNLTVPPEMIWFKNRDDGTESWYVPFYGVSGITDGNAGLLNGINTIGGRNMSTQSPTSDTVYFGGTFGIGNTSGDSYIAYLFASLDGVSKIGTYTGNGSSQTIDCGFSSGARFILVKRVNFSTGDWYIWDTERGIVAGNDPHLSLNSTAAEVTTDDSIDPVSSGFAVNQVSATNINVSGSTYLFYAIA